MSKFLKLLTNIISLYSIGYVLYIGYFVLFDKPVTNEDITKLYSKMGYAFVTLAVSLILRTFLKKNKFNNI
ncbi:hypothetical protein [Paenibacillus lupini]|uniref:hypothetical protein n=1 Tax=Paenibacillus lupini TaxID=1450204 RepID=UPI0014208ACE|nr:hypothetical protein [Paenibacillus lupini]NIK21598.1 hypothetical protein [Paenibacillus lupini]